MRDHLRYCHPNAIVTRNLMVPVFRQATKSLPDGLDMLAAMRAAHGESLKK
jgi:hypothetical protein